MIQDLFRALIAACAAVITGAGVLAAGETAPTVRDLRDMSIEELMAIEVRTVYSASKYEQKVTEAPSSITVITAEDIRRYGYRTLADILKSVRGFYVTNDRVNGTLGVRGFGRPGEFNTRVLLMVDGHRMNDNVYDKAPIDNQFILDVDLIDRVEISRGPSSSLYGSNAFFAVVNVVTRQGKELNGAEVSGEAGSLRTGKGRVSIGTKWNGGEALISGTGYESRGDRLYFREYDERNAFADSRASNNGMADYRNDDRTRSMLATWSGSGLTLEGAYNSRSVGIPTAANGADFNAPGNRSTDERTFVDLKYDRRIGAQTDVTARVFFDSAVHRTDSLYLGTVDRDSSIGTWSGGELRLGTKFRDMHRLMLGGEYNGNRRQDQVNADQDPYRRYLEDTRSSRTWALYIQDEVTLTPALIVNAGIRYDRTSFSGSSTNPRIAVINSTSAGGTVKLLYGSAFRSPNVYELYYQSPASSPAMIANPDLMPERIKTYEMAYEQRLGPGLQATIDGYYYTINDLITQTLDQSGNLVFRNLEQVEARGGELELEKRWINGANSRISYALQRATNVRTGEKLANSPERLAKLAATLPFVKDRLFCSLEEQYTSDRQTLSGGHLGDVWLTNLTVFGRTGARTLDVSLSIYNLFDRTYRDPAPLDLAPLDTVQQNGRTVRVKATYAF